MKYNGYYETDNATNGFNYHQGPVSFTLLDTYLTYFHNFMHLGWNWLQLKHFNNRYKLQLLRVILNLDFHVSIIDLCPLGVGMATRLLLEGGSKVLRWRRPWKKNFWSQRHIVECFRCVKEYKMELPAGTDKSERRDLQVVL